MFLKFRLALFASLLSLSALAAACGGNDSEESDEANVTPAQAIERIGNVRQGLDEALTQYKAGDKKAADKTVGDAYLEEFEFVEGPLEKRNHELTEELEDGIREELRDKIKSGAPATQVASHIADLKKKLDQAEAALR
jgi:hypothetical protein